MRTSYDSRFSQGSVPPERSGSQSVGYSDQERSHSYSLSDSTSHYQPPLESPAPAEYSGGRSAPHGYSAQPTDAYDQASSYQSPGLYYGQPPSYHQPPYQPHGVTYHPSAPQLTQDVLLTDEGTRLKLLGNLEGGKEA